MKKLILLGLLFLVPLVAQDCIYTGQLTSATTSTAFDNRTKSCYNWVLTTTNTGFTAISALLQTAPDAGGSPSSYSTFATLDTGTLPITATGDGIVTGHGYFSWLRINLGTATGTGTFTYTLSGWRNAYSNIAGKVTGPASSTDTDLVIFSGTTGKLVKESNFLLANVSFVGACAANTAEVADVNSVGPTCSSIPTIQGFTSANAARLINTTSPLSGGGDLSADRTIAIANALSDGSTKGASTYTASDFNDNGSGLISLDYTNGQKATGSVPGFLTSTDWTTFNAKVATTRSISTTSPLGGGGDLSADRTLTCSTCATSSNNLSFFSTTTSAQLAGVLSDETGSGKAVFGTTPTFAGGAITISATGGTTSYVHFGANEDWYIRGGVAGSGIVNIQDGNNGPTVIGSNSLTLGSALPGAAAGDLDLCMSTTFIVHTGTASLCGLSLEDVKTDIQPLNSQVALLDILQLKPINFAWKDYEGYDGHRDIGFGARAATKVNPLFGAYDKKGELFNFKDRAILAEAVSAIQELQSEIELLKLELRSTK